MQYTKSEQRRLKERGLTLFATGRFGSRKEAEMEARNERAREIAAREKRETEKSGVVNITYSFIAA